MTLELIHQPAGSFVLDFRCDISRRGGSHGDLIGPRPWREETRNRAAGTARIAGFFGCDEPDNAASADVKSSCRDVFHRLYPGRSRFLFLTVIENSRDRNRLGSSRLLPPILPDLRQFTTGLPVARHRDCGCAPRYCKDIEMSRFFFPNCGCNSEQTRSRFQTRFHPFFASVFPSPRFSRFYLTPDFLR